MKMRIFVEGFTQLDTGIFVYLDKNIIFAKLV